MTVEMKRHHNSEPNRMYMDSTVGVHVIGCDIRHSNLPGRNVLLLFNHLSFIPLDTTCTTLPLVTVYLNVRSHHESRVKMGIIS